MLFDRKLGLFVHWGVYAVGGWQEQELGRLGESLAFYERYVQAFNPDRFDPDEWINLAQAAGMEYLCFTTKHHDGFCMWDTKETDWKVTNTPYGRDVLKELAEACARRNFPLGLYYSNPDWHHPDAFNPLSTHQMPPLTEKPDFNRYVDYVRAQVRELLTGYGKIACFFWDIPPRHVDKELQQLVRDLQPGILVNDRGWDAGDYATPERHIPKSAAFCRPTEACQSVGAESWGYRADEDYFTARFLEESVANILARGGNYLLNVGPTARGDFPPEAVERLGKLGKWYLSVREAFRESRWLPASEESAPYVLTERGGTKYVLFTQAPNRTGLALPEFDKAPAKAVLLNDGRALKAEVARFPTRHNLHTGKVAPDCLHLYGLPVEELAGEALVARLEY